MEYHYQIFPRKNKGFNNYVFCRNWAVRNHAETRLDSSSLVKKQNKLSLTEKEDGQSEILVSNIGFICCEHTN